MLSKCSLKIQKKHLLKSRLPVPENNTTINHNQNDEHSSLLLFFIFSQKHNILSQAVFSRRQHKLCFCVLKMMDRVLYGLMHFQKLLHLSTHISNISRLSEAAVTSIRHQAMLLSVGGWTSSFKEKRQTCYQMPIYAIFSSYISQTK